MLRIVVLAENSVEAIRPKGLLAEHGLSLYLEFKNKRNLFDTGQTGIFLRTARTLGVKLRKLDAIILSQRTL